MRSSVRWRCARSSPLTLHVRSHVVTSWRCRAPCVDAFRPHHCDSRLTARTMASPADASLSQPHHARPANRLANEQSPYLRQHAHNPVDWYPWGPEALEKAKAENKPIFLSVGYATCRWCHVMERESFESEEVAALLNKKYISIKVDREERPDVDKVYMTYVQAVSGGGGWPMSVWLTPDLQPIYGGTYYPPQDRFQGRQLVVPGFMTVLRRLSNLWDTSRNEIVNKAADTLAQLKEALAESGTGASEELQPDLAEHAIHTCGDQLRGRFDSRLGGFGSAPKFPRPAEINVLLCQALRDKANSIMGAATTSSSTSALHMGLFSLQCMAAGGMYDHVGGGFHRYSVDEFWHVPHFEKMLYDNGQLARTYVNAYQLTGDKQYARVARGVMDYMRRELTHPEGGLFSAQDAESLEPDNLNAPKAEGAFYIWKADEVDRILGPSHAEVFKKVYGIKSEGNCSQSPYSDPHEEFTGRNVPYSSPARLQQAAMERGCSLDELEQLLAGCQKQLYDVRAGRPKPSLDDKVVTAWNGLAISAYALASRALTSDSCQPAFPIDGCPAEEYLQCALKAARFVRQHLYVPASGTLLRSYCSAPSTVEGFSEDYAYLVQGLLDLYECGGGMEWLQWAVQLQDKMDELFWDESAGGYFSTSGTDPSITIRMKEDYDGAEPAASSTAVANLLRLAALLPANAKGTSAAAPAGDGAEAPLQLVNERYMRYADRTLGAFAGRLFEVPLALPQMCCSAYLQLKAPLQQVVIKGRQGSPDTAALLSATHGPLVPDKAVIIIDTTDPTQSAFWAAANPEAYSMAARQQDLETGSTTPGEAMAFVCKNYTCQAPTAHPQKVRQLLEGGQAGPKVPQPVELGPFRL